MLLIGISGKLGSGKSSLAKKLLRVNKDRIKISIKDPFDEMEKSCWSIIQKYTKDYTRPEKDKRLMQLLSYDWAESTIDKDIWTNIAISRIKQFSETSMIVVIDDIRTKSNFNLLKKEFGDNCMLIRVECELEERKTRLKPEENRKMDHVTELELDDMVSLFDLVVDNTNLSPQQTFDQVERAVNKVHRALHRK